MRVIKMLFERVYQTRKRYEMAILEIEKIVQSKIDWCKVSCSDDDGVIILSFKTEEDNDLNINASDFFERYEREKKVSMNMVSKCEKVWKKI